MGVKAIRIAYISSYPPKRCGIAEYSASLVGALRKAGHEVLVVGDEPSSSADVSVDLGSRAGLARVDGALATFKPNVLHLQWEPGLFTRKARLRVPKWWARHAFPRVVTIHALATVIEDSPRGRMSAALSRKAEEKLIQATPQQISVPAPRMAVILAQRYGPRPIAVIPLGLEPFYPPRPEVGAAAPCLCFGFITPGKRLEVVVAAARLAPERHFVILGAPAGPRGESYLASLQADAAGLSNLEIHPGWIDDAKLDEWLARASVTLLPVTADYRASAALTRSLGQGVPVVASKGSAIAGLIEETGAGVVAKDAGAAALVQAIRALAGDRERVCQGVLRAQEAFGWQKVVAEFGRTYQNANDVRIPVSPQ